MPRTFTLIRTLGRGAHGSVHLAEVRDQDHYVQTLALKVLHPEWTSDEALVDLLEEEAEQLAALHHDNIVRVHGFTTIGGGLAIQMEPVHGVDLFRLAERFALPARVSTAIIAEVADALDAAWAAQPSGRSEPLRIAHRDIKPANIMITPRGGVRLLDFGVARATVGGPPDPYTAPERVDGDEPSHASDIFALGITFAELLSGRAAYALRPDREGFDEDREELLSDIEHAELRELVGAMIGFDPAARPEAVEVVTSALSLLPQVPGSDLRSWASQYVEVETGSSVDRSSDDLTIMLEDASETGLPALTPVPLPERQAPRSWWSWVLTSLGATSVTTLALAGVLSARDGSSSLTVVEPLASVTTVVGDSQLDERPIVVAPRPDDRIPVSFVLAPGLTVRTAHGALTRTQTLRLPLGRTVEVEVTEGDDVWSCWVVVDATTHEVQVASASRGGCRS